MTIEPLSAIINILIKDIIIYNRYIQYVTLSKESNLELYNIYNIIRILYKERESFTLDELEVFFFNNYPALSPDKNETYKNIFKTIREQQVSDDMLIRLLDQIEARDKAKDMALVAFDVAEGKKPPEALQPHIDSYNVLSVKDDDVSQDLYAASFSELIENLELRPGLNWRLTSLNRILGPVRIGNFGFIFARPETGKTTFLASEVSFMAEQLPIETPAVWFNNEEEKDAVRMRQMQGALGVTLADIRSDPQGMDERYNAILQGKLYLVDDATLEKHKVERICASMKPGLIIFDQLDKVQGFDADREDLKLGKIYQWARELAKKYGPVIAVCQADGTGEGVKWLNMGHVANAKTAKQAEADFILGIGKTTKEGEEYVRYLNISKNKLMGGKDSDEKQRHGKAAVIIIPEIARYGEVN